LKKSSSKKEIKEEKKIQLEKIIKEKDDLIKLQQDELEKLRRENEKLLREKDQKKKDKATAKTPLIKNNKSKEEEKCTCCG